MMDIVVNDTNILIDMHTAGLLDYIRMSKVKFHTVDLVVDELRRSSYKRPLIEELINEGMLYVSKASSEETAEILELYSVYSNNTNLSFVDCSVMLYAKKNRYRLLTSDKKLRNHAIDEGVIVSGLLWVVDLFVDEGLVTPVDMIERLNNLFRENNRLPKKLIEDKIKRLQGMIDDAKK